MDEYIHYFDSRMSRSEFIILVHFGAPPFFAGKEIDKVNRKSLYYNELRNERP